MDSLWFLMGTYILLIAFAIPLRNLTGISIGNTRIIKGQAVDRDADA